MAPRKRLFRSRSNRRLAGVCGGIGDFTGLDPTLVRVGFIIFGLVGVGELVYLLMWLIVPKEPR
jgi:phage shock protein C